jgi:hypothetical protein
VLEGHVLSNVLFALGATGAALVLLDFYLGDTQKKALQEKVESWWIWLDDLKKLSLLDRLRSGSVQKWIVLGAAATILLLACLYFWTVVPSPELAALAIVVIVLSAWLARRLLAYVLSGTKAQIVTRCVAVFVAYVIAAVAVTKGIEAYAGSGPYAGLLELLVAVTFFAFFGMVVLFTVFAPLTIVAMASVTIRIIELTLLRMTEYSKGPILGLSVLLGAIAVLLKVLSIS